MLGVKIEIWHITVGTFLVLGLLTATPHTWVSYVETSMLDMSKGSKSSSILVSSFTIADEKSESISMLGTSSTVPFNGSYFISQYRCSFTGSSSMLIASITFVISDGKSSADPSCSTAKI